MLEHATYKTDNSAVRMGRYLRELQNRARKRQGQDTEIQPDRQSIKRTSASAFGSDADIDGTMPNEVSYVNALSILLG